MGSLLGEGARRHGINSEDSGSQVKSKKKTHLLRVWAGLLYLIPGLRGGAKLEFCIRSLSLAQVIMMLAVSRLKVDFRLAQEEVVNVCTQLASSYTSGGLCD